MRANLFSWFAGDDDDIRIFDGASDRQPLKIRGKILKAVFPQIVGFSALLGFQLRVKNPGQRPKTIILAGRLPRLTIQATTISFMTASIFWMWSLKAENTSKILITATLFLPSKNQP